MSKHTPGPWKVSSGDSLGIVDANGEYVSNAVGNFKDNLDEMLANARLISAAPDMLEALKLHAEWAKREHDGPSYPDGTSRDTPGNEAIWHDWFYGNIDLCGRAEKATIAAIAKATGEA